MRPMSEFDLLVREVLACTLCSLSQKRTRAVPGEGSRAADIVFIGEGPGYYEDQEGRPFVGPAGKLLDQLLVSVGLKREDVYITNMVKCRPPNNRDPLPGEIKACKPYLDRQLDMIAPKIVVTLGRYSFSRFFPTESIGKARGKLRRWKGLTIYPMYHPAAALRNSSLRAALERDFERLPSLLDQQPAPAQGSNAAREEAAQLSLFQD
jgi:DNA polymerase